MNTRGFNTISINSVLYIPWNIPTASTIYFFYWFVLWFPGFFLYRIQNLLFYGQKFMKTFDTLIVLFLVFICYCSCSPISVLLLKLFTGYRSLQDWLSWLCLEFLSGVLDLLLWSKVQFLWKMWLYFSVCCGSYLLQCPTASFRSSLSFINMFSKHPTESQIKIFKRIILKTKSYASVHFKLTVSH